MRSLGSKDIILHRGESVNGSGKCSVFGLFDLKLKFTYMIGVHHGKVLIACFIIFEQIRLSMSGPRGTCWLRLIVAALFNCIILSKILISYTSSWSIYLVVTL